MPYMVVYMRAKETDKGIEFDGPYRGAICKTPDEADQVIRDIIAKCKTNATIPRIYKFADDESPDEIMNRAKIQFSKMMIEIQESQRVLSRKRR